jgi:hypothetical protein
MKHLGTVVSFLAGIVLWSACIAGASAEDWRKENLRAQARKGVANADLAEKKWKPIVSAKLSSDADPAIRAVYQEVIRKGQKFLTDNQAVKFYLQKIASGDTSDATLRLLDEYGHKRDMSGNELEEAVDRFKTLMKDR